jgi:hypothetical protein
VTTGEGGKKGYESKGKERRKTMDKKERQRKMTYGVSFVLGLTMTP